MTDSTEPIDLYVIEGEPRSSTEVRFYISIHPCTRCGARELGDTKLTVGTPSDGLNKSIEWLKGTCSGCGVRRSFRYRYDRVDDWDPIRGHIAGPEPSRIISPIDFLTELDRLAPAIAPDPTVLTWPTYDVAWKAVTRTEKIWNELLKFLPDGAPEIPLEHFRTDEARAAREAFRPRLTRAALDAGRAADAEIMVRYEADLPRYHAMQAAARAAAPPPPPPPAFTKASLDAHRAWTRCTKGGVAGRQLEATDVAKPGAKLAACELSGSILTRVDLAGADLSFADAHHVRWTDVRLTRANLASTKLYSSILTRCDFTDGGLGLTTLGDSRIEDCSFARARLDRSSWYRSDIARCNFEGAVFGQAAFDSAVFVDCNFRGASLAMDIKGVMGTMKREWFYRCDFRDVDWTGRFLFEAVFVDCLFAGGKGTPRGIQDIHLHRCSLDPEGVLGSAATIADLVRMWALPAEHVYEKPGKKPRADERSVIRHVTEDGKPVKIHETELSPLLRAELARDPELTRTGPVAMNGATPRRRHVEVVVAVVAALAACGKTSPIGLELPPTPGPVARIPTAPSWQLDLPLNGSLLAVELVDGHVMVVAELSERDGTVRIAGHEMTTRGLDDLVVVVAAADGTIEHVSQIGGETNEGLDGVVAVGGHAFLLFETEGGLEVAGTTVPRTKPEAGEPERVTRVTLLVELGADGVPTRAQPAFPPGWSSGVIYSLPGGDLAVIGYRRGPRENAALSLLQRRDSRGELQWERVLTEQTWRVVGTSGGDVALFATYSSGARFGVRGLDRNGEEVRRIELTNVRPFGMSGGQINHVVILGSDVWLFGLAGGDIEAGGKVHRRFRGPHQPFVARATASGTVSVADLTQASAELWPIGPHDVLVLVQEPAKGNPGEHRGAYLVRDFTDDRKRRLVPLSQFQVQYENDDSWNGKASFVMGPRMFARDAVMLADGAVLLVGPGEVFGTVVAARVLP